jgi:hypothetical protein
VLVAAGLLIQFLGHLIPFLKRRLATPGSAGVSLASGTIPGKTAGRRDAGAPRKEKKKP